MAARSPNYPAIDLGSALALVEKAFKNENRNRMSQAVLAGHMGYNSLNGRALGRIGAVRAYGLVEGRGDELRVSEDAITALVAPAGSTEGKDALERLLTRPPLFKQIRSDFPHTLPSEKNLTFHLVKRKFTPEAAGKAAKTYLASMRLVASESGEYNPPVDDEDAPMTPAVQDAKVRTPPPPAQTGMLQEVFTLEEGPVTVTFPATLSPDSYKDLADHLEIFLRKAKRRSGADPLYSLKARAEMKAHMESDKD